MADLVSPIVDIISCLWPCCARHTSYLCELQENKDLLRTAMDNLKVAKNDVQRRVIEEETDPNEPKKRTDSVSRWLQSVEKIEGEVEVILQKAEQQQQQLSNRGRCLGGCCPPNNNCWSNYKIGKSIAKKMIPSVNELKVNGKFEEVTYRLPLPPVQPMNLESTVGMESIFDKVWKHITSEEGNIIIGLYGHGGVGKTTLLKKINNEFTKICGEHGFDHMIFVVVSKPINYEAIQNKIGGKLGLKFQKDGDESSRADKIFNQLRNKSFVILLDDIWGRVDLQRIGIPSPPPPQGNSSKLIFTTRSKEVCGLMEATHKFQVECLPWDKAWSLFQEKVGEEALTCFPRARELAKDVAKQCGGLPLALITIGRAMSTTKSAEEWKDAISTLKNYASEFPGMSDDILPRLKLSYDNLRNDTFKSCFRYCALFPEDYSINIIQLVELWIGEGFLDGFDNLDEARDRGHTIIGSLKSACLLESSDARFHEKTHVKMHDVIRDLALWIVNDCKSSINTTDKFLVASKVCERWRNAERIFWTIDDGDLVISEHPPKSPNLRTLFVKKPNLYLSLPQSFFQFTPSLRVLDMSGIELRELPLSICLLYELQYLNLSNARIKKLPIELRNLVKLKFLNLSLFGLLIRSGGLDLGELDMLKQLQELNLGELDRLKQLQELTLTISTSLAWEELRNLKLQRICTILELTSCANLKSISLLPPSSTTTTSKGGLGLGNLTSLRALKIEYCEELEELILFINDKGGETNTTSAAAAAAGLPISNNNKLERLTLGNLPRLKNIGWGEKYHHYMAAAQQQQQHYLHYASPFQNLDSVNIYDCDALKDLTWLVYVETLKKLEVRRCQGLETIIELGDDDGLEEGASGGGCRVFRRLEALIMRGLPNLKSICNHALVFPSIDRIIIRGCPELKKLPLGSGSNVNNTLQVIEGDEKWWNGLQWEDETIKSKFHPYFQKR